MMNKIISTAPARICLFGDHQDYMQLPIIACAINRYITIEAIPNQKNTLHIFKHDLNAEDSIPLNKTIEGITEDYLRLSLVVLKRYNCIPNHGYDVHMMFLPEVIIKHKVPATAVLPIDPQVAINRYMST